MQSIDGTLEERAITHGSFKDHAECTQKIKSVLYESKNWDKLSSQQKEALEMIAHKIGRVLSGNPNHTDHWHDIAGYSILIENELNEAEKK